MATNVHFTDIHLRFAGGWTLGAIKGTGARSGVPHVAQNMRPVSALAPHWAQFVTAIPWTLSSIQRPSYAPRRCCKQAVTRKTHRCRPRRRTSDPPTRLRARSHSLRLDDKPANRGDDAAALGGDLRNPRCGLPHCRSWSGLLESGAGLLRLTYSCQR
jgi:hypothetical protein